MVTENPLLTLLTDFTICFFLCRLEKPAGLFISAYIYIVYLIALRFEGYANQLSNITLSFLF